jgi:hypothetical protein
LPASRGKQFVGPGKQIAAGIFWGKLFVCRIKGGEFA